ncbi:MAG: hypothetical protein NC132_02000 [Corallococcus sp.]|nr:hypothetical protein [Corallococcus sp.]MCM1359318.1 hypothetical protein [Corallococcus sp.]MCM1394871.1 hypothetical protein [Corallococcus sp.]
MEKYSCGRQALGKFADLYGKVTLFQLKRYDELIRTFRRKYKSKFCYLASSSGRVELIGNHTDHNGGKVIGCTVDLDIVAAFLPNETGEVIISGNNYRDIVFNIADVDKKESGSIGMVKGVLAGLKRRGKNVGGFYACLNTTVPSGAGVSSSAAFQLLCAVIQNELYNDGQVSAQTMAEVGQYAENVYFNKPCGLLDQGVIAVGGVVKIDFKNGFEATRLDGSLQNLALVMVDTGKSHSQLTEHYAAIPAEMKAVAAHFGKDRLADVDSVLFFNNYNRAASSVGERPALRAKHFFEENALVDAVSQALSAGDKNAIIEAVNKSGDSSINQLQNCNVGDDRTVADAVLYARTACPRCASRVHGGGFAGTILAVADKKDAPRFAEAMAKKYGKNAVHLLRVRRVGATVL